MRILAFAGSTRKESYNRKLVALVAAAATKAGAEVELVELKDYAMPFYDGDIEEASGLPENAVKLKALLKASDLLLIATPEYNGFFPAVVKNTIDWMSRPVGGDPASVVFKGKPCVIVSASPSGFGGKRAQAQLRTLLSGIGVEVRDSTVAVAGASKVFDGDNKPDEALLEEIRKLGEEIARA
jgi:chromate reductase